MPERATSQESQDAYAADAFAEVVTGDPANRKAGGYTTHVIVDHEALLRGNTVPGESCEIPGVGPVNVAWVRELLGEAFVTAIIKKGKDITTVAHLGRTSRPSCRPRWSCPAVNVRSKGVPAASTWSEITARSTTPGRADGLVEHRPGCARSTITEKPRAGSSARPIPSPVSEP